MSDLLKEDLASILVQIDADQFNSYYTERLSHSDRQAACISFPKSPLC